MDFQTLYNEADAAGKFRASQLVPKPMYVGGGKYIEKVDDGVCGFAWVNLKPGNSKFANWLKAKKLARSDEHYGGVTIWVSDYNQSMQKKEAYASGFASVLKNNGFEKCYAASRMD